MASTCGAVSAFSDRFVLMLTDTNRNILILYHILNFSSIHIVYILEIISFTIEVYSLLFVKIMALLTCFHKYGIKIIISVLKNSK